MTATLPTKTRTYRNHMLDSERWLQIERRPDDIIIATPYKCGTTWMQTIVMHLIFQDLKPRQVDEVSRWVDAAPIPIKDLRAVLDAQTHRRVLKSHLPMNGFYYRAEDKMIVVGRDPRDVFMSFCNHYAGYTDVAYAKHNDWPGRPGAPLPPCPIPSASFGRCGFRAAGLTGKAKAIRSGQTCITCKPGGGTATCPISCWSTTTTCSPT
jgi:aryl sulfotransferase